MTKAELEAAHEASTPGRKAVEASKSAGCFCCLAIFPATHIVEFTDDGDTPLCPTCGVDSVIVDSTGWTPTPEFLKEMERHWFALMDEDLRRERYGGR